MLQVIGFILFLLLVVLLIGIILVSRIIRGIFNIGKRMTGKGPSRPKDDSPYTIYASPDGHEASDKKKKIFDRDEGEYIDFEEIKD